LHGGRIGACTTFDLLPQFAALISLHAQAVHGNVKVLALLDPVVHSANKRERFLDRRSLVSRVVKVTIRTA